jgi:hypothetical protein
MEMKTKIVLMALFVALATMGFDCINDNFLVSVNIKGISGTYNINAGNNSTFTGDSPPIDASTYLDPNYSDEIKDVRIYDIRVSTVGTYAGNINGATAQVIVNGVATNLLGFSGPWSTFNVPQSLLTSQLLSRSAGGITALVNAIKNKQSVTLRGFGSVSQIPVPSGLSVKIEVFGQVDAQVK